MSYRYGEYVDDYREGQRDAKSYRHESYDRSRYDGEKDRAYFEGYDEVKAEERRAEERREEENAEIAREERRRQERMEEERRAEEEEYERVCYEAQNIPEEQHQ